MSQEQKKLGMLSKETKQSKFTRMAEVLPQNARTAAILKERDEIRQAREATEKAVSHPFCQHQRLYKTPYSWCKTLQKY